MQHIILLCFGKVLQKIIKLDTEGLVLGLQKDAEYHCGEIKLNENDLVLCSLME